MAIAGLSRIFVHSLAGDRSKGRLHVGLWVFPCALGRSGVKRFKREGDGATPRTDLPLRRVFFRRDRLTAPATRQTIHAIRPDQAWCDDLKDRRYNRLITRAPGEAEERLQRADHLYDIIVELGWNDRPVQRGHGSAIFWHCARPGFTPTAGCIAIRREDFRKILPRLARNAVLTIRG